MTVLCDICNCPMVGEGEGRLYCPYCSHESSEGDYPDSSWQWGGAWYGASYEEEERR